MSSSSITVKVDPIVKEEAKELFAKFGLDLSTAINVFLRYSIRTQTFPVTFELVPNQDTLEAIAEAKILAKDPTAKRYHSAKEAFEDVLKSC